MATSKVLVVDDDPIHQRIAQIMIDRHHIFDVCTCYSDGQLAINYLREHTGDPNSLPDVILLDLNMPNLDGWGFLEQFLTLDDQIEKDIKIYIVSSSVDEKDIIRSKVFPFVSGFISKPLSPEILRNTH